MSRNLRNIAIIAHVDHGKTTMVDQLLRQSGTFAEHEKVVDTVMDNNAIERERGITIFSKRSPDPKFRSDGRSCDTTRRR